MFWKTPAKFARSKSMEGHVQCSANYVPLSPISFLKEAAIVNGERVSIVYGTTIRYSWRETHERCLKLASALCQLQIFRGDIVAAFAPNIPALYELHFGVPMAGAILSALNIRLDAAILALILEQLEAKIIFVDYQFIQVVLKAFNILSQAKNKPPLLVLIPEYDDQATSLPAGSLNFNELLEMGRLDFQIIRPINECDPISVNYTSGSTGKPKGVVYSHRAAYLNSLAGIIRCDMRRMPVFLWTVDMFRCNGWCFTWAVAALGGTNICLRDVTAKAIFDAITLHNVTHLCGAPTLLNIIADAAPPPPPLPCKVDIIVAGALQQPQIVAKIIELGFNVTHAYGMTEALGPVTGRLWQQQQQAWDEYANNFMMEGVDVKDPETMISVPNDGKTIGEVMFRGNTLMMGYYKNSKATQEAFKGGWFRTGDIGIRLPNGYVQMKDRVKDMIISAEGEIISTLEVEAVLVSHPNILEAAVVGRPDDDHLGQTPCAFVKLKEGFSVSAEEIINFCAHQLPHFMVPQTIVFGDLPVNSTGKVQKFVLREKAKAMING